jgi:hypothetical protein
MANGTNFSYWAIIHPGNQPDFDSCDRLLQSKIASLDNFITPKEA